MSRGRTGARILGGSLRGRPVHVPEGVRPTSAKAREALGSIWDDRWEGARFLDLFAGAGLVGLEAWSRGAERVVFVESDRGVHRRLAATCAALTPRRVEVLRLSVPEELRRISAREFDLVFLDPPYAFAAWEDLLTRVGDLLAPEGALAAEHSERVSLPAGAGRLARTDERRYGDTRLSFYRAAVADRRQG